MSKNDSKVQECAALKAQFSNEVARLLHKSNPEGRSLFIYLQRLIVQNGLHSFDVQDCAAEAVVAGLEHIDKNGKEIRSAVAWMKRVGACRVRNQVRVEIKNRKLNEKQAYSAEPTDAWQSVLTEEERGKVKEVMQKLSAADQDILHLRFVRGMSYKEIQSHYLNQAPHAVNLSTLRKRESRALRRLKIQFSQDYQ